jgi:hypothetical protein
VFQEKPGPELPDRVTELAHDHLALRGRIAGLPLAQSDLAYDRRTDANDCRRCACANGERLERAIKRDLDDVAALRT